MEPGAGVGWVCASLESASKSAQGQGPTAFRASANASTNTGTNSDKRDTINEGVPQHDGPPDTHVAIDKGT